ncbi:MAG: hypothetical protein K6C99_10825 [Lachnospiraceae bacterium]|nr:hypothetical protein [Lachnospiraceae bacterium]
MKNKLMKLEIRENRKLIFFILSYMAVLSVVTGIVASIAEKFSLPAATELAVVLSLCAMMGILLIAIVMAGRFYSLLFTEEGLLRLTLPVKNRDHLQINVKLGIITLYVSVIIYSTMMGSIDSENTAFGLYGVMKEYYGNFVTEYVGMKAFATTICIILAIAAVIANYYITFIFVLTLSRYIVSRYSVVQKKGVIFIAGITLFNIHLLMMWAITNLIEEIEADLSHFQLYGFPPAENATFMDFLRYNPEGEWVKDVIFAGMYIIVYGITAVIMYRTVRSILDRKLEV